MTPWHMIAVQQLADQYRADYPTLDAALEHQDWLNSEAALRVYSHPADLAFQQEVAQRLVEEAQARRA